MSARATADGLLPSVEQARGAWRRDWTGRRRRRQTARRTRAPSGRRSGALTRPVSRYLPGSADEEREQCKGLPHSYGAKVLSDSRPLPGSGNVLQARLERRRRADEQQVAIAGEPHRSVRKHRAKRRDDGPEIGVAHVVGMRPLTEDAAGCESAAHRSGRTPA